MPNLYNFNFDEASKTYKFITKNAVGYKIAFVVDETFSAVSGLEIKIVYQIIIEKVTDNIEKFDSSVSFTVKHIVKKFFDNSESSMIYINYYICNNKN